MYKKAPKTSKFYYPDKHIKLETKIKEIFKTV